MVGQGSHWVCRPPLCHLSSPKFFNEINMLGSLHFVLMDESYIRRKHKVEVSEANPSLAKKINPKQFWTPGWWQM